MRTVVLVPFRGDGGRRDQLWIFARRWLENSCASWPIFVGASPEGPFNRSAAINDAAHKAEPWDVALIMDADTIVSASQLHRAVAAAATDERLAMAFTSVLELSEPCTEHVLATGDLSLATLGVDNRRQGPMIDESSAMAVNRFLWDKIGGFDERFVGWMGEDNAFFRAATITGGEPSRVEGHAFHLWHPPATDIRTRERDPQYRQNMRRWQMYRRARNERDLKRIRDTP